MDLRLIIVAVLAVGAAIAAAIFVDGGGNDRVAVADPENTLVISLKDGDVYVALRPDLAPNHVNRLKTLTREGFYDGLSFHRVIDGFMAQTGDPTGRGSGGSNYPNLIAEFSSEPFNRGTVGMARKGDFDSANSQFFIMFARVDKLDGNYTVLGQVVHGMDLVDGIKRGSGSSGKVRSPDKMVNVRVAADI